MTRPPTPFANGTEVDWWRSGRCDRCTHDHDEGGGCDPFVYGVLIDCGWATDGRLYPVPKTASNPLGVECHEFTPTHPDQPTEEDTRG
ncbi:hypothetical protein [Pseudonocardia sp. D17]|uniref:hypothetical protein n=1 Tax=Pseudonocardia sp. D17 TaxID=882661 RepID=UPI002B37D395|nr:hypothetical protein PSD17_56610 [Pseudonocardia sp. D17]